jgi:hypothetical protein
MTFFTFCSRPILSRQAEIPTNTVHIPLPSILSDVATNRTLFNTFGQTGIIKVFGGWRRAGGLSRVPNVTLIENFC